MDDVPRKFGPLSADDPLVGDECPACKKEIVTGDYVTILDLGPGDEPESRQRARAGRPYNAVAVAVHYACATGVES